MGECLLSECKSCSECTRVRYLTYTSIFRASNHMSVRLFFNPCLYIDLAISVAYWCCPLAGAACCSSSNSCCPKEYPVCCGGTNSCCFEMYPVCCFPGTSQAYCCAASSPVCLGSQHCGSLDPNVKPVLGKVNKANQHREDIVH